VADAYGAAGYACSRYAKHWAMYANAGDEIGLHVHAWRRASDRSWVTDHSDAQWVRHCTASGIAHYRDYFGGPPRSFRFGDRFLSNDVVDVLEHERVVYDLTLEPGHPAQEITWDKATGLLPDCRRMPRLPYQPSRANPFKRGSVDPRRMWMIPVSTARPGWLRRPLHLNLCVRFADTRVIFDKLLASAATTHICWVMRTGDLANPTYRSNFIATLDLLTNHRERSAFRFVRPDELVNTAHEHAAFPGTLQPLALA